MSSKVVDKKVPLHKYQIYLNTELHEAFTKYIQDEFASGGRVVTAVIRKAIAEFLEKRGYYAGKSTDRS